MKIVIPRILLPALICFPLALLHAQEDVSLTNVDSLLKEIDSMEQKQKDAKSQEKTAVLTALKAASTNGVAAANFYEKAIEEVQFNGKKDKASSLVDWKKANADFLRSKEMQTALLLHLRYLTLAIQRKGAENPETMVPAVMAYVNELLAADPLFTAQGQKKPEQKNLLEKPLGESIFTQWMQLGQWLPDDKVWEQKPGDIGGILEKNVRPLLREKKDPQLLATWDLQIKIEADQATQGRMQHEIDKFNNVTRPRLLFKRAQDMVLLGQPNRGAGEMVALLRANPSHPDFAAWLESARGLLKKPEGQTSPQ